MCFQRQQIGISLVSMMIGLLISMVALLGMMSLYGTVVRSTVESTHDARIAGERSSALLVASMQMQGAGYGIDAPSAADDLLLLAGAALDEGSGSLSGGVSVTNDANTLIWRFHPDDQSIQCAGLYAKSTSEQSSLYLLLPQPCNTLTEPDKWEIRPLLIDNDDVAQTYQPITFSLAEHHEPTCSALGIAGAGKFSVTLHTADRNNNEIVSTTCLLNFSAE